jgi:hypothetical protein
MQDKGKQLVAEAREIAQRTNSWIDWSNALADPNGGLSARYFPDAEQPHGRPSPSGPSISSRSQERA